MLGVAALRWIRTRLDGRRRLAAATVLVVLGASVIPAMAATGSPSLTLSSFDGYVLASGKGFDAGPVAVTATAGPATGTTEVAASSSGRFVAAFEPPAGFDGKIEIQAVGGSTKLSSSIAFTSAAPLPTTEVESTSSSTTPTSPPSTSAPAPSPAPAPTTATPAPTTATPSTPPASNPAPVAASGTWDSGLSGTGESDGSFEAWRGSKVTSATYWCDGDLANHLNCYKLQKGGDLNRFTGSVDVAIGGIYGNETFADGAAGKFDDRWRQSARNLASSQPASKQLYIRPFHELNGDWYRWSVNSSNVAAFKASWIRMRNIFKQELPNAKFVFNANKDSHSDITNEAMWPGDQYVDVYGVDFYDMYPSYPTQAAWDKYLTSGSVDKPSGLANHQAFAKRHGVPMSFPEWGLNNKGNSDDPVYIKNMNNFFRTNAGSGPGQVVYENYFNVNLDGGNFQVMPGTKSPNASAMYKSLKWGS